MPAKQPSLNWRFRILPVLAVAASLLLLSCEKDTEKKDQEEEDIASLLVKDDGSLESYYKWWTIREAGWTYYSATGEVDSIRPMVLLPDHDKVQFGSRGKTISSEIVASFLITSDKNDDIRKILPSLAAWKMAGKDVFHLYISQTSFDLGWHYKEGENILDRDDNQIVNGLGDWKVSYTSELSLLLFEREENLPEGRKRGTHFVLSEY